MAASAHVPLDIITNIVRKVCTRYGWDKRDSTYKTFLRHVKTLAEELDLSLEDLATSSLSHTRDIDYSKVASSNLIDLDAPFLKKRFQNIPYIIYVGEDNITTVVIRKGNVDCPIKEITVDMMQLLRYLGVVRVYVMGNLPIPCWTDNIIYIYFTYRSTAEHAAVALDILEVRQAPFPIYLRGLIDMSGLVGTYTNRLPASITTLTSSCTESRNLGANLKNYTYNGHNINDAISQAEYLPVGLENACYVLRDQDSYRVVCWYYKCQPLNISEITMPPGTDKLEIGLSRIYSERLIFKNIRKLNIYNFKTFIDPYDSEDRENAEKTANNLLVEYTEPCGCCKIYRQNIEVILQEGIKQLSIKLFQATEILLCINEVPASLESLIIRVADEIVKKDDGFSLDGQYYKHSENAYAQKYINDFIAKFPQVRVVFE
jgi:hypothetical protein